MTAWRDWSAAVAACVASVSDALLAEAAQTLFGSNIVLCAGNGGSAAIASHATQAILKPSYKAGGGRAAVCLTDNVAALTAHANDGGWSTAFVEVARPFLEIPRAALLLVSSSGKSENLVRLAELARAANRRPVVALTGFDGGPLRKLATVSIYVDSHDYEVVEPSHDALIHRIQRHLRALASEADA